jgi:hypothetical protein
MPTYTYFCEPANEEFEEFHSIMIVLDDCPVCKEKGLPSHAPKRLISGGSGRGIVELQKKMPPNSKRTCMVVRSYTLTSLVSRNTKTYNKDWIVVREIGLDKRK